MNLFGANKTEAFVKPSKDELKKILTPEQYSCTQEEGTEAPFKNAYWNHYADGIYVDLVSGEALFSSLDKFDSKSGWPSFTKPIDEQSLTQKVDRKLSMPRIEIRSKLADSHLGHVFDDGPKPTGKRFCINSAALKFIPLNEMGEKGYGKYYFLFKEKFGWDEIVLAGGCFWGMQELYRSQPGVVTSEVGYSGDSAKTASYEMIKKGQTNHAEAVRVLFDPKKTSLKNILFYFFKIHDPTTKNRQGNDIGAQYRSEIFYASEQQKKVVLDVIKIVDQSKKWPAPVVTAVNPLRGFYRGEENHQDYLQKHPGGYTCHFPRKIDFEH